MQSDMMAATTGPEADVRAEALRRLKKKRDFRGHLLAYVMVNALLWVIWGVGFAMTGAMFPWPLLAMFGWGIGLVFHAWDAYGRGGFSEEEIQREELRIKGR